MAHSLRIGIDGKDDVVDAADFARILQATLRALGRVSESPARWSVGTISHASPVSFELLGQEPNANVPARVLLDGLRELEDLGTLPEAFDNTVLRHINEMLRPLSNGVSWISFDADDVHPVRPTLRAHQAVERHRRGRHYWAHTELEGFLTEIAAQAGQETARFAIVDRLTAHLTRCEFRTDDIEDLGAQITHRVRVVGQVEYSSKDEPVRIKVEEWAPVGAGVSLAELHTAGFRLEGEESAAECIRRARDLDG